MIDYVRIRQKIYVDPAMILPSAHQVLTTAFERHIHDKSIQHGSLDTRSLDLAEFANTEPAELIRVDSTGVVPVKGIISREISQLERACGAVGVEDVRQMIEDGLADPTIDSLVLDVDSPGGGVTGLHELAEYISDAKSIKPIIAHTSGSMCSAAYYLSVGASAVYSTGSATVGSIGTYIAILDESRALESTGRKVEMIKAGDHKAVGYPGTTLDDDQRAALQAHVDELNDQFQGFVIDHRPAVAMSTMDGRFFTGNTARDLGLVDSITDLDKAISDAHTLAHQIK